MARGRRGLLLLLVACAIAGAPESSALSCAGGDLTVWPASGASIPLNGQIVLEGGFWYAGIVGHVGDFEPELVGGYAPIPVVVRDTYLARNHAYAQSVLVPARPLRARTRYELRFRRSPYPWDKEYEVLRATRFSWTTSTSEDVNLPRWLGAPQVCDARYWGLDVEHTWGSVRIATSLDDPRARVLVDLETDDARVHKAYPMRWLLPVERGEVSLLAGGCGGQFYFPTGARFRGTLTAIDAAGNHVPAMAEVTFQIPSPTAPEDRTVW